MQQNEIQKKLKLETSPIDKKQIEEIESSKKTIKLIWEYLLKDSTEYTPKNTVEAIKEYLKKNKSSNGSRILYSEISNIIFDSNDEKIGILATNLDNLLQFITIKENKVGSDCYKIIIKFYDHFNLACQQKNMSTNNSHAIQETLKSYTQKSIEEFNKSVQKDLKKLEREYITILGIFATIVLSFVGGLAFSTSVLQNLKDITIFRLLITIILLAFVLVTVVYVLAQFIFKINDKKMTMWPIILFDSICLILLAVTVLVFNFCPWIISEV